MIFYLTGCIFSFIATVIWIKKQDSVVRVGDIIPLIITTLCSWFAIVVGLIFLLAEWVAEHQDKELF